MIGLLGAAALAAGGVSDLPPRFSVHCEGVRITKDDPRRTDWRIDLYVDLDNHNYAVDRRTDMHPIAWIGDANTPMFLQLGNKPGLQQENLDLDKHLYTFIGVERRDGRALSVVEQATCSKPSPYD